MNEATTELIQNYPNAVSRGLPSVESHGAIIGAEMPVKSWSSRDEIDFVSGVWRYVKAASDLVQHLFGKRSVNTREFFDKVLPGNAGRRFRKKLIRRTGTTRDVFIRDILHGTGGELYNPSETFEIYRTARAEVDRNWELMLSRNAGYFEHLGALYDTSFRVINNDCYRGLKRISEIK